MTDHVNGRIGERAPVKATQIAGFNVANGTLIPLSVDEDGRLAIAGGDSGAAVRVLSVAIPATLVHGQTNVTTAGTEVALASSTPLLSGVTVKAKPTNTGLIYVGGNPVTSSTGFILEAGESIFIEVDNVADVYIDAAENGEGVSWIGS